MKIHIISLLAVLISSKVKAQALDENLTNLPDCWTTGTDGRSVPSNYPWCIASYRTCLQALEDDISINFKNNSVNYYIEGSNECAQSYGDFYPVSDLQQDCIDKWHEHCHDMKLWGFHRAHIRNECRRKYDARCAAIYRTFKA